MQNIIFINHSEYNDTLVGPQLIKMLDRAVFLDGNWCFYTDPLIINDTTFFMAQDNMVYTINNFILSKQYNNIVVGWNYPDDNTVFKLVSHLKTTGFHIAFYRLTNTSGVNDVGNLELINKEYFSKYYTLPNNQLIKVASIDTTGISAFKIAKVIEGSITK